MRFLHWFPCILFLLTTAWADAPKPRPSNWAQPVVNAHLGNFYKVSDDLYRSDQPSEMDATDLKSAGVRTVISLRHYHHDPAGLEKQGLILKQHHMDAESASIADLVSVLREYRSSAKPVLIHCWHGSDRTGFIIAGYRVVFMNWSPDEAIEELRSGGFGYHQATYPNIMKTLREMDVTAVKKAVFESIDDASGPVESRRSNGE